MNADPFSPPRRRWSYGAVLINEDASQIFLREPTNHHNGHVWTFAKGMPDGNETPEQTASREAAEEYGLVVRTVCPIPEWFCGPSWANFFYLCHAVGPRPEGFCWETSSVRWFGWEEARNAIGLTIVAHRRERDLNILDAAFQVARCLKNQ